MPDRRNETDWLAKIPLWFKAGVGFLGAIATIAGFIVAWREQTDLFLLVTVALLLGGLFLLSLYVFVARRKTRSRAIPAAYRFGKLRPLGLLGMMAICMVLAASFFIQSIGDFVRAALQGPALPTPSFTPSPTLTPAPTPSPVPSFTPVPPPRVEDPDVWIAPFRVRSSVPTLWAEAEIEEALSKELQSFEGQRVTVRMDGPPIESVSQAQDILNNGRTAVVIWGEYNQEDSQVRMLLSDGAGGGTPLVVTDISDILPEASDPAHSFEVTLKQNVPENISFLSLFVIGHLAYLSNKYATGHQAFDAAMKNIPESVIIQNKGILSFFQAREMQKREEPDLTGAICKYVQAILEDRQSGVVGVSDVAYNNLGLAISTFYESETSIYPTPVTPVPPEAAGCLQQLELVESEYQDPKIFFQRALDINPNLTLARYNRVVFEWLQKEERRTDANIAEFLTQLDQIESEDASIVGTYILRAILYDAWSDGRQRDDEAIEMYLRGIEQDGKIALMRLNVGQLYLSHQNDLVEAERQLQAAIRIDKHHQLAHLALGNLYYRSDRLSQATNALQAILTQAGAGTSSDPLYEALLIRSGVAFKEGQLPEAREYLNRASQLKSLDAFSHVLLGLLSQFEGRSEEAFLSFNTAASLYDPRDGGLLGIFASMCFSDAELPPAFGEWMRDQLPSSTCLGRDLNDPYERVRAFYDIFSDGLLHRRDPALFYLLGAQCPFVYTQDPLTREWEFDTTILYKVVNKEAAQIRPLKQFNGQLLIREEEPEISYLNRLYVIAELVDGSSLVLEPDVEELKYTDKEYVVLHRGEEILITLDNFPVDGDVRQWWVMAVGYYSPQP